MLVTLARNPGAGHGLHLAPGRRLLRAVAEDAELVEPPAARRAVGLHRAGVVLADRDVDLAGEGRVAGAVPDLRGQKTLDVRAVAELVVAVVAPAVDAAVREAGAGVVLAGGDLGDAGERTRAGARSSPESGRAAGLSGAVAELTVEVVTPAVDAAVARRAQAKKLPVTTWATPGERPLPVRFATAA